MPLAATAQVLATAPLAKPVIKPIQLALNDTGSMSDARDVLIGEGVAFFQVMASL